jgi:AraC-like DNA-binding protein
MAKQKSSKKSATKPVKARKTTSPPIAASEAPALEKAMKFIRKNFAKGIRLTEVAEIAGISPFHFHRRFTKHFGTTPKSVMTALQIEAAKKLLLKGVPADEVAKECGFAHHSHLCSRFSLETGMSPGRWLKSEQK